MGSKFVRLEKLRGCRCGDVIVVNRVESQIERLQAEHTAPHMGLSDEQAVSLERFAADVQAGHRQSRPEWAPRWPRP
jgi:hypothetical protein